MRQAHWRESCKYKQGGRSVVGCEFDASKRKKKKGWMWVRNSISSLGKIINEKIRPSFRVHSNCLIYREIEGLIDPQPGGENLPLDVQLPSVFRSGRKKSAGTRLFPGVSPQGP